MNFHQVITLPETLEADAMYFVLNGDYSETYITDDNAVAKLIGNSTMINALIALALVGSGDMVAANNLSDIVDAAVARANLNVDVAGTDNSDTAAIALNTLKVSDINHVAAELPNVDNTSDVDKPVSTLQQAAIDAAAGGDPYFSYDIPDKTLVIGPTPLTSPGTNSVTITGNRTSNANAAVGNYAVVVGDSSAYGTNGVSIGRSSLATASDTISMGRSINNNGASSSLFGHKLKNTIANVVEFGYWSNSTTRGGSTRGDSTGQIQNTIMTTAPTDAGAVAAGSEAVGTLARGSVSEWLDGLSLKRCYNDAGTIKTITLGTFT